MVGGSVPSASPLQTVRRARGKLARVSRLIVELVFLSGRQGDV